MEYVKELVSKVSQQEPRDGALLAVLASGLKTGEVVSLRKKHVDAANSAIRLDDRVVEVPSHLTSYVLSHIENLSGAEAIVFEGYGKKALTPRAVQKIVKKHTNGKKPHYLRDSYAKSLLAQGDNVEGIRQKLGLKTRVAAARYKK